MTPLLVYHTLFFRAGSGDAVAALPFIGGVVQLRILGNRDYLPVGEAFVVELEGLKDSDGAYANAAELTATVLDANDAELITPVDMDYVAGSHGTYQATMPGSLVLTAGEEYRVVVAGDGVNRVVPKTAQEHGGV